MEFYIFEFESLEFNLKVYLPFVLIVHLEGHHL